MFLSTLLMHITVQDSSEGYQYNFFIVIAIISNTVMTEGITGSHRGMNEKLKRSVTEVVLPKTTAISYIFALLLCKNKQYASHHLSKSFIIIIQAFCGNIQEQMEKCMICTIRILPFL